MSAACGPLSALHPQVGCGGLAAAPVPLDVKADALPFAQPRPFHGRTTLVDEAILREWLVNMAHRPAKQRLAHHVCEMLLRARAVGLTGDHSFEMPLTQDELGNTMGLSTVHINRTMQELRGKGLITTEGKRMIVNDIDGLMEFSGFDPNYLHQVNKRARLAQVEVN